MALNVNYFNHKGIICTDYALTVDRYISVTQNHDVKVTALMSRLYQSFQMRSVKPQQPALLSASPGNYTTRLSSFRGCFRVIVPVIRHNFILFHTAL
jgi:hypothetical protein